MDGLQVRGIPPGLFGVAMTDANKMSSNILDKFSIILESNLTQFWGYANPAGLETVRLLVTEIRAKTPASSLAGESVSLASK